MNTATIFLLMASVLAPPVKTSAERSTRIYVRTIPPGASVVLDGKELGTTDGLFLVPPGVRTITLEMDGYDPKAEKVDVREGWITRVEVRLEPARKKPGKTAEIRLERVYFDAQGIPTVDGKPATLNDVRAQLTQLEQPRTTQVVLVFPAATPFSKCQEVLASTNAWKDELGLFGVSMAVAKDSDANISKVTRTILLPDAHTKDAGVVLDLASGKTLKLPRNDQEGDPTYFTRLGKGDIGFDSELFCPSGGEVEIIKDDGTSESLRVMREKDDATIYRLSNIPCQLLVTTAEKRQFVVKVLEKTAKGGLKLEYREKKDGEQERVAEKAKPPVESTAPEGFEPERRLRIYDDGSKAPCMVDLDTGRLCPRPAREEAKDMSAEQWMASKGIDAGCETNPAGPGLWGMDMIVLPVASAAWENPRAAAIESELRGGKPGSPAIMSALGGLPRTFWFATREGGKGILQITSQFNDDEGEGFEFKYRLISRPKAPAEVKQQLKALATAAELYCVDTGRYPKKLEMFLTPPAEAEEGWSGPYIKSRNGSVPVDPWGNPYQIFWGGKEKERFLGIGSSGPDSKFGTEDDLLSFELEKGQTPTPAPEADKQTPEEAAENGPGSALELRICANEEEAKAFEKLGGEDLGWYASAMEEKNPLVTREVDGRAEVLLWKTADKSLVAAGPKEKPWRVIKVSVIAEPDKPGRIGVVFDVEGGRRMRQLTAANIDRRLAVLVDGRVVACPIVRSPMGERVEITGNFSKADLNRIATAVQAGMEEKE